MSKSETEAMADALTADAPRVPPLVEADLLSTGSTLLNLAFTGSPRGGVPKGTYLYLVGDSGSLKTWLALSLLAEAARNPKFKKYRFVYDASENGAIMSVPHFFGRAAADRMEPPAGTAKDPVYSRTVQEMYYHLDAAMDAGPCIFIEDSMDALNDETDEEAFAAERRHYETGKGEVPGNFGVAKAKANSRNINRVVQRLRETGSILVVISQTRDKIGSHIPGLKTRGGGRALRFYAHLEAWTSLGKPIPKRFNGKDREIGHTVRIDVQKNRACGWEGKIEIPFLKNYGIDDAGSCVDYLLDEKHWKFHKRAKSNSDGEEEAAKTFDAPEFSFAGTREELVAKIQGAGDEWELQKLAADVWRGILVGSTPERKPRYT